MNLFILNAILTASQEAVVEPTDHGQRSEDTARVRWFLQLCGGRHIASLEPSTQREGPLTLARVLDEFSITSNAKLDGEHMHPGLGCWSILHLSVSLTQEKPLGQLLSSKTLL